MRLKKSLRRLKGEKSKTSTKMHFLITTGGTREYIDPVRFISNASSGKMGCALVRAAVTTGHKVTLITAPTTRRLPKAAKIIEVETAGQMFEAVKKHFGKCDCIIMAAAVADYTVARPTKTKIKKSAKPLIIKLEPTVDILKWAGQHKKKNQVVAGFALEDKNIRKSAQKKLEQKNLDMIIANTPNAIGAEKSTVQIKRPGFDWVRIENATKTTIARKIIRLLLR